MSIPSTPNAATIRVREVLDLLDGPFLSMAEGLSHDHYALWLGSGISLGRVPGLRLVVERVLRFLQRQVTPGNVDCRFRRALDSVRGLAALTPDERARNDIDRPIEEWPDLEAIKERLVNNYARMLDVPVDGEEEDYLLWAGVDVAATYADSTVTPDAEHLCIAVLAMEGVISDIASANWDGLIERAVAELSGNTTALTVLVRPEDTRGAPVGPKLYKFHGCAVRAQADPANFRSRLIARQSQINGWAVRAENAVIANRLIDMVTSRRTLMLGLSAQDSNIQGVFVAAEGRMNWPWPDAAPAFVFSEDRLGIDQDALIRNVYPTFYSAARRQEFIDGALVRAYAKPLLLALVLHVLYSKLSALVAAVPGSLSENEKKDLCGGILEIRNSVSQLVERIAFEPFLRILIAQVERVLCLFWDGECPAHNSLKYRAVFRGSIPLMRQDQNLSALGIRELAAAIGILGFGKNKGHWEFQVSERADSKSGAFSITSATGKTKLFFAANSHVAVKLRMNGFVEAGDNAVIVYATEIPAIVTRSPRNAFGRSGKANLREVSIKELLDSHTDIPSLFKRFQEETLL